MEGHGEADGPQKPNVLPGGHPEQRLVLGQTVDRTGWMVSRSVLVSAPQRLHKAIIIPLPVESVAHLNSDEHRQGHGHGVRGFEHLAVQAIKVRVVWGALEEVALWGEGQRSETEGRSGTS